MTKLFLAANRWLLCLLQQERQDRMEPFNTIDRLRQKGSHTIDDVEELRVLTKAYPAEPELWELLGDLMQICNSEFPIQDSIRCYERAVESDPTYASAYESLGWAFDSFLDDFENARKQFELSIEHGGGDSARIGLARVLAQMGKTTESYQRLLECDDGASVAWIEMCREIREGLWYSQHDQRSSEFD